MAKFVIKQNGVVTTPEPQETVTPIEKVKREIPQHIIEQSQIQKETPAPKKSKQKPLVQEQEKEFVMTTTGDKKVSLSYSRLRNYLICPKRFEYHTRYGWEPSAQTTKTMQAGNIFEALLLGDKNDILKLVDLKKKYAKMLAQADYIKQKNLFGIGESYVKIAYEHEYFSIRGEIDYIGKFMDYDKIIVDLKYTGKIDYIWQDFKYKEDALQLIIYSWVHWKNTGEILPCAYCIVESSYDEPVYQIRHISVSVETYDWLERFLLKVAIEPIKLPNPTQVNCLGSKGKARCAWLQYCPAGREILGGIQTVDSDYLPSKTENNLNY